MTLGMFFFGTLRDPDVRRIVLGGHVLSPLVSARLEGHEARGLAQGMFPVLVPKPGAAATGLFVPSSGLSESARARLAFFEGEFAYEVQTHRVVADGATVDAQVFATDAEVAAHAGPWDLRGWTRSAKPVFLEVAREVMSHFGVRQARSMGALLPGILARGASRAHARVAATAELHRSPREDSDVEPVALERPFTGFFSIEKHKLRHRRHDGGMSEPIEREVFAMSDAVTLLPYDAKRDRVLLIEQFRAGPYARADRNPWCLEAIAGRAEPLEATVLTAIREAKEEAGLDVSEVIEIGSYYTSPGATTEYLHSYLGRVDLDGVEGVHGVAEEGEDIRSMVLDWNEAATLLARGEVDNAPLLVSLLWLAARRDHIRKIWA